MGIRTNGTFPENRAAIYSRKNGNSNKWDSLNQYRCRKTKMGSSAVNILEKVSNFLVTKLRHAKNTTDSEVHVSTFHANFQLKSYTVPSEVVPTPLNSEQAHPRMQIFAWSVRISDPGGYNAATCSELGCFQKGNYTLCATFRPKISMKSSNMTVVFCWRMAKKQVWKTKLEFRNQ